MPVPTPRSGRWWRWLLGIAIVLVIVAALLGGGVYWWFRTAAQAARPQLDGTIRVGGLHAPVTVVRDGHGVPSITAGSLDDLFFAQGYVTAQDRLWQMDMMRRYAAGELAAALGADYVKTDRAQRVLGLRQVAERSLAAATPEQRAQLEAYANGVNAYISEHQYGLPLEMRVLRYFPRAWTPLDSVLVGISMDESLNHGEYLAEINREKILQRLGPELTADLYPDHSPRDIIPGHDLQEVTGEEPKASPEEARARGFKVSEVQGFKVADFFVFAGLLDELKNPMPPMDDTHPGSNNWVISGAHTASGRPLLSNDMHLQLRIPNTWYMAHLTCGAYDVAGVTLPGAPWVIVGHNRRIAWGFTNLGPDVEDVYVENFNAQGEYQTPSGWRRPEVRHEVIHVKRGRDVEMDVLVTRHGPIISGEMKSPDARKLALHWALFDTGLSLPMFAVNSAQNWDEFRAAFSQFTGPGQNVVYADVDGNIGYQATGRVPIRASGDGTLPVSGADDAHEWTGYIPFDAMPRAYNPPSGIIATANSRTTPDDYPYMITREWESPYRTERIYRVLRQNKKFTAAEMLALQMDTQSELDRFVAERMVYAVDQTPSSSARAKEAAEILRHFDGKLSADSNGAAIEQKARAWLMETLLANKLGNDRDLYRWFMKTVWLENLVAFQPERWRPAQYADWNALLAAAVEAAVSDPEAPAALASWKYGDYNTVQIAHQLFRKFPWLKQRAQTARLPLGGNGITVRQVGEFQPSERFTADFAELSRSTLNIVNGQSGDLFSPHFNDQFDAWYRGTTYPLPFDPQTVEQSAAHRLTLE